MASLIAGSLAGQAASHSADMVGDFKIGHLLGAAPRGQAIAQIVGTLVGIVPVIFAFMIYGVAYPCALDPDAEKCPFGMPAAHAWRAIAVAMTEDDPLPLSAGISPWQLLLRLGIGALIIAGLVILTVFIREHLRPKYRPFVPNWSAIGLAWVIPHPQNYAFPMAFGAIFAYFVQRCKPRVWNIYGFPSAAGLAAGEACSGLVLAALVVAGLNGDTVGLKVGVPWT